MWNEWLQFSVGIELMAEKRLRKGMVKPMISIRQSAVSVRPYSVFVWIWRRFKMRCKSDGRWVQVGKGTINEGQNTKILV